MIWGDFRTIEPRAAPSCVGREKRCGKAVISGCKNKKGNHRSSYPYNSVGVTGFEPATTCPPDDCYCRTDNADFLLVTYLLLPLGLITA